jgi:hypothetical protein
VRLVIHREDDEIYETLDVELVKKRERGLGLRYQLPYTSIIMYGNNNDISVLLL